jgi:hypothetical protein
LSRMPPLATSPASDNITQNYLKTRKAYSEAASARPLMTFRVSDRRPGTQTPHGFRDLVSFNLQQ